MWVSSDGGIDSRPHHHHHHHHHYYYYDYYYYGRGEYFWTSGRIIHLLLTDSLVEDETKNSNSVIYPRG